MHRTVRLLKSNVLNLSHDPYAYQNDLLKKQINNIRNSSKKKFESSSLWEKSIRNCLHYLRPGFSLLHPYIQPILDYKYDNQVAKAVNIHDMRKIANKRSHNMVFQYLDGGADDEHALNRSTSAYKNIEFRHAVLHGVSKHDIQLETTILGHKSALPFLFSSCAGQKMFHADGESAVAKAAHDNNIQMALSQLTTTSFDEVASIAPNNCKILQLYVWKDKTLLSEVLKNAINNGFTSLVLTADFSWVGNRERETKSEFTIPPKYTTKQCIDALLSPAWTYDYISRKPYGYAAIPGADFAAESLVDFINQQMKAEFNWCDAKWLVKEWKELGGEKCALKGVSSSDDAKKAISIGFDTIWISNHGGRQLDYSVPTIETLPEIRRTIGNETEIIIDGGIRRGIDIIKSLALGADSVAIGRGYLYGLAAGGYKGVDKIINILRKDIELGMGLLGCTNINELKQKSNNIIVYNNSRY